MKSNEKGLVLTSNQLWFTNLPVTKKRSKIYLKTKLSSENKNSSRKYVNNPHHYYYENFNCINVDSITDIPCDYYGLISVPHVILKKNYEDEFEILGACSRCRENISKHIHHKRRNLYSPKIDNKFTIKFYANPILLKSPDGELKYEIYDNNSLIKNMPFDRIIMKRKQHDDNIKCENVC